jgi:hypothetical protein
MLPFDTNDLLKLIFVLHYGWEDFNHVYSLLILCTLKVNKIFLYTLTFAFYFKGDLELGCSLETMIKSYNQ